MPDERVLVGHTEVPYDLFMEYLNELAPSLDRPLYHLLGTRMAIYSRKDFVRQRQSDSFPFG